MRPNSEQENAFIRMIRQHERIIYKVCSFYVSEDFPIEDLYQETVCNLWRAYPKFRGESGLSTWIYRVALNTCISGMRKNSRKPVQTPLTGQELFSVDPEEIDDNLRELYRMIYKLQALERAIVLLWLEEKSYREIADITGLTVANVAVRLNRAKEKLKVIRAKYCNYGN